MAHQAFERAGLVVDRQPVDDGLARLVEADDLDLRAFAPELQHHLVERRDAGDVPDVGAADVDDVTCSSASLKSKAAMKSSAEAKKSWPSTTIGPRGAVFATEPK